MKLKAGLEIVEAERVAGGLIIHFSDGKCGLYSASLLHSNLALASRIDNQNEEDDQTLLPQTAG